MNTYKNNTKLTECCKRALANASRHVFAFAQKYYSVIEEVNNLHCALIVHKKGVSTVNSAY